MERGSEPLSAGSTPPSVKVRVVPGGNWVGEKSFTVPTGVCNVTCESLEEAITVAVKTGTPSGRMVIGDAGGVVIGAAATGT